MRKCELRDLGRIGYAEAFELQRELVSQRKKGEISDQLLFVEHPHVITMGRNGHMHNILAGDDILRRAGIEFHQTDRGGDVTYHGPDQILAYPIFDLREWRRDVLAYVRALEQVMIDALALFGIEAERSAGATGVWVKEAKIAVIGVHISRWITSHGFALNHTTDLAYFQYIVPCGLTRPVTSLQALGVHVARASLQAALTRRFSALFDLEVIEAEVGITTERLT